MDAVAVEGPVKRRVAREIPAPGLLINNRAHLPGPCVRRIPAPLIANFVGKADANGPVPFLRHAYTGTNVVADPIPSLAVLHGSENVEAGLEPVSEAVGDFDGLV